MYFNMRTNFVLSIGFEIAFIARVFCQLQVFCFDVEVEMIVALKQARSTF